jgi:hypothetical protein
MSLPTRLETAAHPPLSICRRFGNRLLLLGDRARSMSPAINGPPVGPARRSSASIGKRSPSFGLVLVFDKSGAVWPTGRRASKIELARQAVMRVLDVLPPPTIGVIAFDANPVAVTSFGPGQRAADVARQLEAIVPGGPTRIAPAASLAVRWLNDAGVRATFSKRQILLMSDGQTSPDDEQQLRAAIGATGVEVSTVAIGSAANRGLLQQLANSTGGRAYFPSDLAELPKIVAREAARSRSGWSRSRSWCEAPHPITAGIDPRPSEAVGYVVQRSEAFSRQHPRHTSTIRFVRWPDWDAWRSSRRSNRRGASMRAWPGPPVDPTARWVKCGLTIESCASRHSTLQFVSMPHARTTSTDADRRSSDADPGRRAMWCSMHLHQRPSKSIIVAGARCRSPRDRDTSVDIIVSAHSGRRAGVTRRNQTTRCLDGWLRLRRANAVAV